MSEVVNEVDETVEDIGEVDLGGDHIPDELDAGDLDDLLSGVDPDDIEEPDDEVGN